MTGTRNTSRNNARYSDVFAWRIASGPIIKVVWSPDGTRVACTSGDCVHVLNVETGSNTTVVRGDNAEWLDDNTLVIGN